jgi:WD40 repeat protein
MPWQPTLPHPQIIAAASDCSLRIWCAATGAPRHVLAAAHARAVHIVETHPLDARLALSAGYDGISTIWDVREGAALHRWVMS